MQWDLEVDVACVGSGIGGIAAALTAADHGADALVLEKASGLGGVTGWSLGQLWVGPTSLSDAAGLEDDVEDADAYLEFLGSGHSDRELRRAFLTAGRRAVDYFAELGIEFEVIRGFPDYYFPKLACARPEGRYVEIKPFGLEQLGEHSQRLYASPHGNGVFSNADFIAAGGDVQQLFAAAGGHLERNERCGGQGLMAAFIHAALQRGVTMETESRVVRLIGDQDSGVEGLVVETPGGVRRVRVRQGVVLATGGYDYDQDLVRRFEQTPDMASMSPTTVTGDHFALAGDVGGFVAQVPPHLTPHPFGIRVPGQELEGTPMFFAHLPGQPHSIVVNKHGRRFADEAFYHDSEAAAARIDGRDHENLNWPAWFILDQDHREKYMLGPFPPGAELPPGTAAVAETLEDLAHAAGIDPEGLSESVLRFNEFCADGVDADFGRGEFRWSHVFVGDRRQEPNPNLGPITRAPFYAVRLHHVATSFASAGLLTDVHARVLTARNAPVPGLYAVGNAAARLDVGGYNSGIANTRGMAFGHVAAEHMVAAARQPGAGALT